MFDNPSVKDQVVELFEPHNVFCASGFINPLVSSLFIINRECFLPSYTALVCRVCLCVDGVDWISKLIIRILHDEESPKDWEAELVSARNLRRGRWERFHQSWLAG